MAKIGEGLLLKQITGTEEIQVFKATVFVFCGYCYTITTVTTNNGLNNTCLFSQSSTGQKSEMLFTESKPWCGHDSAPLSDSRGESILSPASSLYGCISCVTWLMDLSSNFESQQHTIFKLLCFQQSQHILPSMSDISLPLCQKDMCDCFQSTLRQCGIISPFQDPQFHYTYTVSFLINIHRFQGLGPGHLWGPLLSLTQLKIAHLVERYTHTQLFCLGLGI